MTVALDIPALAHQIRDARGLAHKRDIDAVVARLGLGSRRSTVPVGDDCAAIPDGDGHLLFAIEGFLDSFVAADPYFAGYCGIMVNLSDVAAMGGRPLAVVDALWSRDSASADPILAGLSDAAALYGVPVVGGHTNTRAETGNLAVAVLGPSDQHPAITPGELATARALGAGMLHWHDAALGADDVDRAHAAGLLVCTYTTDDAAGLCGGAVLGIDAMCTNDVPLALQLRAAGRLRRGTA